MITSPKFADGLTLIDTYFARAVDSDRESYVALFAADAIVEDEGRERHGRDAVREWRGEVPNVTYTVRSVDVGVDDADRSASTAVTTIAGAFPGSPVDLRFTFRFDADGRISELRIRP